MPVRSEGARRRASPTSQKRKPAWLSKRRRSRQSVPSPWGGRIQTTATLLVGVAAVAALWFTGQSVRATNAQLQETRKQLQIQEQGQITDRYNAAITNLGSASVDVRLDGIYALQRIMQDSPRDQPTVVAVLCAFVRDNARTAN
jgi:hypothetical protein